MSDTVKFNPPENHYIQLDIQFATEYGVNEALLFAKLFRVEKEWHGFKDKQGVKWVRLTYDEWEKETPFFSRNTIIRTLDSLVEQGIIFAMVFNGRSKWYRCNQDYVNLSTQNGYIEERYVEPTTQSGQSYLPKMGSSSTQNGLLPISSPKSLPKEVVLPQNENQIQHRELALKAAKLLGIDHLPAKAQVSTLNTATQWLASVEATPADLDTFSKWWYTWATTPPGMKQVKDRWTEAFAKNTNPPKVKDKKQNGHNRQSVKGTSEADDIAAREAHAATVREAIAKHRAAAV